MRIPTTRSCRAVLAGLADVVASTPTSAMTSAQTVPVCRGVQELDGAERRQRHASGRSAPRLPPMKDEEEHGSLEQPRQDERVAEADEIGAKHAKRRGVDEADVAGVHVLHLQVQRLSLQNPLRDVSVVPFVGRIPEPVVVGSTAGRRSSASRRQRRPRVSPSAGLSVRGRGRPPRTAPDDRINDVVMEVDGHVREQRQRRTLCENSPRTTSMLK